MIIRTVQDYHPSSREKVSGASWSQETALYVPRKQAGKAWHVKAERARRAIAAKEALATDEA